MYHIYILRLSLAGFLAASAAPAFSAGIYRDGASARSMALGGNDTAAARGPLDALSANPAALSELERSTFELHGLAGFASGRFDNRANDDAKLDAAGILPALAVSVPAGVFRFGLGIEPVAAMRADWRYRDTPGGADGLTSYGVQTHRSEVLLYRAALGTSWQINDALSIGVSGGLLYNRNRLEAPYIFQSQPVLRTAKTLLDLRTEGFGWDVQVGLLWKPVKTVALGASYTTKASIRTTGHASADAGVQFARLGLGAADSTADYDAEVTNHFPQKASVGAVWNATPKLTVAAQIDWLNLADSFDTLKVRLKSGNDRDLNGLVGSDRLDDDIPLKWRDQWVGRIGLEYALDAHWALRAGYAYSTNPVPSETLTPLTAAITEHTLSAGVGYKNGRAAVDLAWQWALPKTQQIGKSELAAGEYSDSAVRIGVQWLGLTTGWEF